MEISTGMESIERIANAMDNNKEGWIDMSNIKNRNDMERRMQTFFRGKPRSNEPTPKQISGMMAKYGIEQDKDIIRVKQDYLSFVYVSYKIRGKNVTRKRDVKTGRFVK